MQGSISSRYIIQEGNSQIDFF